MNYFCPILPGSWIWNLYPNPKKRWIRIRLKYKRIRNPGLETTAVLWIRIRLHPKLFAGSGSVIITFGSGSYELQFLVTKIALVT